MSEFGKLERLLDVTTAELIGIWHRYNTDTQIVLICAEFNKRSGVVTAIGMLTDTELLANFPEEYEEKPKSPYGACDEFLLSRSDRLEELQLQIEESLREDM